ncbi:MAG: GGDEF domain-containing protein [Lachnospiraceae bacterium]|nr:GGDEF domain-containing protein [Lachnospiraceae bacterium]
METNRKGMWYQHLFYVLVLIFSLIVVVGVWMIPHQDRKFYFGKAMVMADGWVYESYDGKAYLVNLDNVSKIPENMEEGLRMSYTLPDNSLFPYDTIGVFTAFQRVRFFINDTLIYDSKDQNLIYHGVDKSDGSFWNLVSLPGDFKGKTLTMELTSPYADYRVPTGTYYLGTRAAVYASILFGSMWRLVTAFFLILLGLFLLILSCVVYRRDRFWYTGTTYFSISVMCLGVWFFVERNLFQLFFGNANVTTFMSFLALKLFIITFLQYFRHSFPAHFKRVNQLLLIVLYIELIASTILQMFKVLDYYEMIIPFHALIVLTIICILTESILERFYYRNYAANYMFISNVILAIFSLCEIITFYRNDRTFMGLILCAGVVLYSLILYLFEMRRVAVTVHRANQSEYFRNLAMLDVLTGCFNRGVMQQWLEAHEPKELREKRRCCVLLCDVDHLKTINDSYGHQMGDQAIIRTGILLKESFLDHGICCRIGGDEFACFLEKISEETLKKRMHLFEQAVRNSNEEFSFPYCVSIGYAFFDEEKDQNLSATINRADQNMYLKKNAHHKDGE